MKQNTIQQPVVITNINLITLKIKKILSETLELRERANTMTLDTALIGSIPELDSVAIVAIILSLEKEFAIMIPDDEISAKTFETLGTLAHFITERINATNHI